LRLFVLFDHIHAVSEVFDRLPGALGYRIANPLDVILFLSFVIDAVGLDILDLEVVAHWLDGREASEHAYRTWILS
jgi:hypothetical protein